MTNTSIITTAGLALFARAHAEGLPIAIDRMIFADIPGLDTDSVPSPDSVLPAAGYIVKNAPIDAAGAANANTIIYTHILPATDGPFHINWIGLYSTQYQTLVACAHVPRHYKFPTSGFRTGNTFYKHYELVYRNISDLTGITIPPESWQFDADGRYALKHNHPYEPEGSVETHNNSENPHTGKFDVAGTAAGLVSAHNSATDSHTDIRAEIAGKEAAGVAAGLISAHNSATDSHTDIRSVLSDINNRGFRTLSAVASTVSVNPYGMASHGEYVAPLTDFEDHWCWIKVQKHNDTCLLQEVTDFSTGFQWYRWCANNGWSTWQRKIRAADYFKLHATGVNAWTPTLNVATLFVSAAWVDVAFTFAIGAGEAFLYGSPDGVTFHIIDHISTYAGNHGAHVSALVPAGWYASFNSPNVSAITGGSAIYLQAAF